MQFLSAAVEKSDPLININDRKNIIRPGENQGPAKLSRRLFLEQLPLHIIDKETLKLIQVLQLHQAINYTKSTAGSAVLLQSLAQPGTDLPYIQSKQESLREIESNDELRLALADCVHEYSNGESSLFKFFNKGLYALFPYPDINRVKKSAANITKTIDNIPKAESNYLRTLI